MRPPRYGLLALASTDQARAGVRLGLLTAALAVLTAAQAQAAPIRTLDGRSLTPAAIDRRVGELMAAGHVNGLALALIRDGRVAYVKAYGQRDVAKGLPLQPDTVMYGASLTKATFAYMVMQLVDEGRVDLDRPIAGYLPKPLPDYPNYADLAGDERWRKLTLRILLDHTSGFANFRWLDADEKLRFHRDPGARFGYSGEGINLAQFVLEKGLGLDVAAEMQRRVFDRFGMTRTSMLWREDFHTDFAQGYAIDGKLVGHDKRENVRAAGSMDTTVADWSAFLAGVARGEGLSAPAKAEMIRRQIAIDSPVQFPTLVEATTEANKVIKLGYGLGWGVFETPFGHAYFKEGHDDGTANYALCVEPRRACILLMSNDVRAEGIYVALADGLMGRTNLPWRWMPYVPFDAAKP